MWSWLSWIYNKLVGARAGLYRRGVFESFDLGARTISIGNITVGGTGKTPMVAYVARALAVSGEKVCVLTRGYGRNDPKKRVLVSDFSFIHAGPSEAGDEPFELAQKLKGDAIVIADADRVAAAEWAKRRFGTTVFVLDDGFQHLRARRDIDIVCIDATDPFGGGKLLPAGRLREPVENLSRAHVVVITRSDLVDEQTISNLKLEIAHLSPGATVFTARSESAELYDLENFIANIAHSQQGLPLKPAIYEMDVSETKEIPALAFCGLGNPDSFFRQLIRDGFLLAGTKAFRDHHQYTQKDIDEVQALAGDQRAGVLLTTAKDAVKLERLKFSNWCVVVTSGVVMDDAEAFNLMLF